MATLSAKIDEFCNPFTDYVPSTLVNTATGQTASKTTEWYLINTLKLGSESREKLTTEWDSNNSRFLKTVKRTQIHNFAAEHVKEKKSKAPASHTAKSNAEMLQDLFIRMVVVIA
ncbi:hypothetical protein GQR58_000828 [Nymphon striatum]|nr:hypothetical protein GQR58_026283 [Nymphon striatum]KAG1714760.1 hypothetical protein GQR58_000828 [Nymphon striatum]